MNTILVTGANGFIGSHLVEECQQRGFSVLAGVREGSDLSNLEHLRISLLTLDYSNKKNLIDQLSSEQFEYIIHVAGVTVAQTEREYLDGNYSTTENLIEATKGKALKRFVLISSLAARGPGVDSVDSPVSQYGMSKLKAEKLLEDSELQYLIVRPTAVYGPRNLEFLPLFKWAKRGLIFSLGSPNRKLSFIHVSDLVRMVTSELHRENRLIHASDGKTYSLAETNETIKMAIGRKHFLVFRIPSKLFEIMTSIMGVFMSILRNKWRYPSGKVRELIAADWSIKDERGSDKDQRNLKDGFIEMARFFSQNGWL